MQHRGNVLIGLRTDADHISTSDSETDIFASDDLKDGILKIRQITPTPIKIESTPGLIKNFSEISPYFSPILANLENYTIPTIFTSDVYFIPKTIVPDDLSRALLDFSKDINGPNSDELYNFIISYNSKNFPDMILAQIELIKYIKTGKKDGLWDYTEKKLDSRILSLLHFALVNQDTETNIERQSDLYHEVLSLQEYIKFPTPAPLATLFPHFTVPDIIYRFCLDLINEFPSNPFLESVLTSFQPYCPRVEDLITVINTNNDSDDFHFFKTGNKEERLSNLTDTEADENTNPNKKPKKRKRISHTKSNESSVTSDQISTENKKSTENNKSKDENKSNEEKLNEYNENYLNSQNDEDDSEYDFEDDFDDQNVNLNNLKNNTNTNTKPQDKFAFDFDSDSLSDDSFFMHLKEAQTKGQALITLHEPETIEDPLDLESKPANRYENIILREPPQMSTYLFLDGTDQMSPTTFENWIFSIRCDRPEIIKSSAIINQPASTDYDDQAKQNKQHGKPSYKSSPIAPNANQSDEGTPFEETAEFYFSLLSSIDDQIFIQKLPTTVTPPFYSLYLPILHTFYINDDNRKVKSNLYPKLIAYEKDAHQGLRLDDRMRTQRTLTYFKDRLESYKFDFELVEPHRLEASKKRKQPTLTPDIPDTFIAVMAVIDYELIIHSRSPLSLEYYTVQVEDVDRKSNICDAHWRASFLFWQYTTNCFSPYMCFRIAFALAVNLAEKNPDLSCSFAFEALYVFLSNVPFVRKLPCIRSALLFFGELLEKLNRYYYAAHVLDNFFLSDIRNASYSSRIAQIASKNNDVVRAIFHYNQTLKSFVAHGYVDEALYIGQVIASIYIENSFISLAIQLLTYLLYLTYDIPVGKKREKMDAIALGSLRIPRLRAPRLSTTINEFKPCRKNLSTILSATMLSRLLSKKNFFSQANGLIEKVMDSSNISMKKLLLFTQAYIGYQENNLNQVLEVAPSIELPKYVANASIRDFISTLLTQHTSPRDNSVYISPSSSTGKITGSRQRSKTASKNQVSNSSSYFGLRPSLSSHFSMLSASNFDPNTATLRLLSRTFLERGQFRQAFIYSELFIHSCSSQNTKELGCGFFYRGMALTMAAYNCQGQINLFELPGNEGPLYSSSPLSNTCPISISSPNLANENSKEKMKEIKERIEKEKKEKKEKKLKEKERDPKILQHDKLRFPKLPFQVEYDSNKLYTKDELAELAFISFSAARSCFVRVSSSNKLAKTSLMMLDLLITYPDTLKNSTMEAEEDENSTEQFDKKLSKRLNFSSDDDEENNKNEGIDLNVKKVEMKMKPPVLLTHFHGFDPPSFYTIIDSFVTFTVKENDNDNDNDNVNDNDNDNDNDNKVTHNPYICKIDEIMSKTDILTSRILDPIYIIHLEILSAAHNIAKGMKDIAQTKFDYAFNNFQKFFVCGYHLIPIDISLKKLRYIKFLLEKMCMTLTYFDPAFINDRLLAFDIYNDVSCVLNNRFRNIEPRNLQSLEPSIELSSILLELENPKFPSFAPILQSNGIIDDNPHLYSESLRISECLDFITANIKLYNKEKITIDEMRNRNRKICISIVTIAENTRRQNSSQLPPDTTFSFLQRCKPEAAGAIFVQRLFNHIVVYVPSTGYMHRVEYPYPTQLSTNDIDLNNSNSTGSIGLIYGGGNGYTYHGSCMDSTNDGDGIVNINIEGKSSYEFVCDLKNCLFSGKFIEFCASLLLYNDNKKVKKAMSINSNLLASAAKSLFGKELLNSIEATTSSSSSLLQTTTSNSNVNLSSKSSSRHNTSPIKLTKKDSKSPKKDKDMNSSSKMNSLSKESTSNLDSTDRDQDSTDNDNDSIFNTLNSNSDGIMKLIFIASHDMQFIPFEVFFPNCFTIRCPFLMQMMLLTTNNTSQSSFTRSIFFRYKPSPVINNNTNSIFSSSNNNNNSVGVGVDNEDDYSSSENSKFVSNNLNCVYESGNQNVYGYECDEHPILSQNTQALQRTRELLNDMLTSFGSGDKVISFVDGFERLTGFPIPLFQTFKEADFKKYSFCDFVDLMPNEFPRAQNASSSLFIFSFTDLCEMPALVRRVLSDYPFSFFLFVPVAVTKDALKVMKKRFNAEKKKNAENSTQNGDNNKEKKNPMNFVLELQMELQKNLKVPVPLISYLH